MNEKTYPSDLTDEEWEWIKDVIPAAKSGGRPRTLCMRAVLNAIFSVTNETFVYVAMTRLMLKRLAA